jgi:DNA modification methylase
MASEELISNKNNKESLISAYSFRSPKRASDKNSNSTFPYYAGYSEAFAEDVLRYFASSDTLVLDPWNGSGTTTTCAERLGIPSIGMDLNPVMCIVARARSAHKKDIETARSTWLSIQAAVATEKIKRRSHDPLSPWFSDNATAIVRNLVNLILKEENSNYIDSLEKIENHANRLSKSRAILIVALFVSLKKIVKTKNHSNPTWNKRPSLTRRYSLSLTAISTEILLQIRIVESALAIRSANKRILPKISCSNAESIPLKDRQVDFILTSPPYCTRIDYAISTLFELAVLGFSEKSVDVLRRKLTGTTAIRNNLITHRDCWGDECKNILYFIKNHTSHGSKNYYHKNFEEYFSSLYQAISEISRVLRHDGICAVVLQSSYYKERVIDLSKIFIEMANNNKLYLISREKYKLKASMARLNTLSSRYRQNEIDSEELLVFKKN